MFILKSNQLSDTRRGIFLYGFISVTQSQAEILTSNTTEQINSACSDVIASLSSKVKINSSEEYESVLEKLKIINNLLPTGPRNFVDLMSISDECNCSESLEHFASEHYPVLLQEIIQKTDDYQELFNEVLKLTSITVNLNFIIETLNVLTSGKLMDNNTTFIAQLIERLMLCDENYLVFSFIKLSHIKYYNDDLKIMGIDQYIQQLISLPGKIANRMKLNFSEAFKADAYAATLLISILKSIHILVHINRQERTNIYGFSFISKLISKIAGNFKTSPAIKCAIKILSTQAVQTTYHQEGIQDIMKCLQRNAIEIVAVEAFGNEMRKQCLLKMFGDICKSSREWKFVLTKKLPLFTYFQSDDLLIDNLVFFIAHEDNKLMDELLMEMLAIWSTKTHTSDTPFEQHFYVTKFIVLMVAYVPNLRERAAEIRQKLFNGVQMHFSSSDDKLRALGMITAETIISLLDVNEDTKEEDKLKFDYDSIDKKIVAEIIDVIRDFPLRKCAKIENVPYNEDDIIAAMHELISLSKNETFSKNIIAKECLYKDIPKETKSHSLKQMPLPKELDSDDDDLQAYPDDLSSSYDKKRPRYVLDIIKAFTIKEEFEDVEKFELTITSARDIIKQQLHENHSDMALDLLRIFIDLQMHCYVENFEDLKTKAVVEVCSIYPTECAQYIGREFNTEITKYSMRTRMYMLDILSETAKRLSKLEFSRGEKDQTSTSNRQAHGINKLTLKLQEELDNRNKKDAQRIIRERLLAKTRRIASRTKISDEGFNQFASVAGWFFFPLVQGFGKEQMNFTKGTNLKHDIDSILLVKFIHTLSVLMLCAENATIAPKMAKEIVNLSVFLRYHEESKIRLAVLHLFATIILIIPKKILVNEFNAELNEFINHLDLIVKSQVVNYEPDTECREFAKQLLSMCYRTLYAEN